ncbi:MAG: hypothetical protein JRH20_07685 [Deltaproteobacteria bacterium]|nr:hypothetical protein [Deltaproteobacteria bacterium]
MSGVLLMGMLSIVPSTAGAQSVPTSWWVNANGFVGPLSFTVDPRTHRVRGTLHGTKIEGTLVGRHLVVHRYPHHKNQIWQGWIMDRRVRGQGAGYRGDFIMAGTFSVNGEKVLPFFAVEQGKTAGIPCGGGGGTSTLSGQAKIVAGVLHGLRWEMPCASRGRVCRARVQRPMKKTRLGGDPRRVYNVTLRFRGVVEQQSYTGGKKQGYWYVGGRSANSAYNIYKLQISAPPQTYYLNAGRAGISRSWPIDYTRTVQVRGGAQVLLTADAQDGSLISNTNGRRSMVIPGVSPAPRPYDGQFIQMDVLKVR